MFEIHRINTSKGKIRLNVILIHGLAGHPIDTWSKKINGKNNFWPKWLVEEIPGLNLWTIEYKAPPVNLTANQLDIEDTAKLVLNELKTKKELKNAPLLFICHSLGGIILKKLLNHSFTFSSTDEDTNAWLQRDIAGIIFLGTPHKGSRLATYIIWIWLVGIVQRSTITQQLSVNNKNLITLNNWFSTWKVRPPCLSFYETEHNYIIPIVSSNSADPNIPNTIAYATKYNHFNICKFETPEATVYKKIIIFITSLDRIQNTENNASINEFSLPEIKEKNELKSYILRRVFIFLIAISMILTIGFYTLN